MSSQNFAQAGFQFGLDVQNHSSAPATARTPGELERWFDARVDGNGVWKCRHYFDIYERHFRKFVGREVHVLEVGIYSGGSLEMWRDYFGAGLHLYGVDIAPEVSVYETEGVRVLIGDQADPAFWERVLPSIPRLDIVIDDGGHMAHQQRATLEAVLPVLAPGGVYLCEDLTEPNNEFWNYVNGLERNLHHYQIQAFTDEKGACTVTPSNLQRLVSSIHQYPYVTVIERTGEPVELISSERHGSSWQPFNVTTGRPG